jgi:hypothetical protein
VKSTPSDGYGCCLEPLLLLDEPLLDELPLDELPLEVLFRLAFSEQPKPAPEGMLT